MQADPIRTEAHEDGLMTDTGHLLTWDALRQAGGSYAIAGGCPWLRWLAHHGRPGDAVAGPTGATILGWTPTADAPLRLLPLERWGIQPDSPAPWEELESLQAACDDMGWRWRWTASAVGMDLAADALAMAEEAGRVAPRTEGRLPLRYRRCARSGLHTGPMVAAPAYTAAQVAGPGELWDRSAAYLWPMEHPLPLAASASPVPWGAPWERVRTQEGIVGAVVDVSTWRGLLPPLPVHTPRGVVWPRGLIGGYWSVRWLRWAEEEHGVKVAAIIDGVTYNRLEPILRPAFEAISEARELYKPLAKAVYTRLFGRLCSVGWAVGELRRTSEVPPAGRAVVGRGLAAVWESRDEVLCAPRFGMYRPDWSAWIAEDNALNVLGVIADRPAEAIAAAHVDAVWCAPGWGPAGAKTWNLEAEGPMRIYGVGTYDVGESRGRMGPVLDDDPSTALRRLLRPSDIIDQAAEVDDPDAAASAQWDADGRPVHGSVCQPTLSIRGPTWSPDWRGWGEEAPPMLGAYRVF